VLAASEDKQRVAKLSGSVAVIKVGAAMETELEDRKLRIKDVNNATFAAIEEGIVSSRGMALVHLSALVPSIKAGVIDPTKVTWCALQNTASVAGRSTARGGAGAVGRAGVVVDGSGSGAVGDQCEHGQAATHPQRADGATIGATEGWQFLQLREERKDNRTVVESGYGEWLFDRGSHRLAASTRVD
jgi:hypothetical protein